MDNPASEIEAIILTLCQGTARQQDAALHTYFLPDAAFLHPLCCVPRFRARAVPLLGPVDSLSLVQCIYRWYLTFAPNLDMAVESTAFDEKNNLLYATVRQHLSVWFFPIYSVTVKLVTVLKLEQRQAARLHPARQEGEAASRDGKDGDAEAEADADAAALLRYYIASQEDLYQLNYCLEFALPHIGALLWTPVQLFVTAVCVVLSVLTLPLHYYLNPDNKKKRSRQ